MPLFQKTVLQKYIRSIDSNLLETQWKLFAAHFHNPAVQHNIRNSKEEQYQEGFVDDLFVKILGYIKNPTPDYNFITEQKNEGDSKKADGAIIIDGKVRAVVELKGCNTTDLGKVEPQAFGYKSRQSGCDYVLVSNFEKLRFYVENAVEHIEFNLFELSKEDFGLLWLCLSYDSIATDLPLKLKKESLSTEDTITKKLYQDYSIFRRELFNDLVLKNPEIDKLLLFKKTQKLLDRFLFIFFAEDRLLLPVNLIKNIIAEWEQLRGMRVEHSLYERFKLYFNDLNTGNPKQDIFAYNGGLFQPDEILDNLKVDDQLLFGHTHKLSTYDFESEVDVNILGHIFENSLNEIEEIENQVVQSLPGLEEFVIPTTSKRKKDGVFYTPKYITKYIVENTLGKLCAAKKAELEITDEIYTTAKKRSKKRLENLQQYRDWLLQLSICDPACGSGAFLNQALEFLIEEHRYVDELSAKYNDDPLVLSDVENSILENNLYGVDINEESVHIAKLSLWLRTAQRNRKLNDLNQNLKCGNSLIDDPKVAGEKAFDWEKEFPQVFKKGGFDVVIGNPPWGAKLPVADLEYIKLKHKDIIVRMIDSFMFFMDKSFDITSSKGITGMIIPDVVLYQKDNSKLREKILKQTQLRIALNVGDGIFEDVARPSAIVVYSKTNNGKATIVGNFNKYKDLGINMIETYEVEKDLFFSIPNTVFATRNIEGYKILNRHNKKTLADFIDSDGIQRGVSPDLKEAFIISKDIIDLGNLERDFIRKTVTGGVDVKRYYVRDVDKYLFYITKNDSSEKFPKIFKYIEQYRPQITCKEVKQGKHPFYSLHRARKKGIFEKNNKILGVITGDRIITSIDGNQLYPTDGLYVFSANESISNEYLSAILNSKLATYLYRLLSSETGRTMAQVKPVLLAQLPFIKTDRQFVFQIENLYNSISDEIKLLTKLQTKFTTYFSGQYNLQKLPRKLENWYELDFPGFVKELNKAIKKTGGTPLSKKDEFEWMELFEENKAKAQVLQNEIEKTDKEIDQMVYGLYGLTGEEIAVVENG